MFSIFKEADNKEIESNLDAMLADCIAMFDLAMAALFGDRPASEVQDEIWGLDKQVNRRERAVRRELLVRGAVRHAEFEQGLLLAYMSVAKDLERIGDYCKNIWDLANIGVQLGEQNGIEKMREEAATVREYLVAGRKAFAQQDQDAVHDLIPKLDAVAHGHDEIVFQLARSDAPASEAVPQALYYRFLKRIVSHLENVLTSVVMPLDRIDYYKPKDQKNG
ncbi:MAG: PhoU domain-containing protein [Acidimicrobiales bacterium]|nr:PhoU domain-containing protein [Acidimicrobiales bacterium]